MFLFKINLSLILLIWLKLELGSVESCSPLNARTTASTTTRTTTTTTNATTTLYASSCN